jgi:hypothetical protein
MSQALAAAPILVHDQGRVVADMACVIVDGARVISDFRVMPDQRELSGLVAPTPAEWRTLKKIALAGTRTGGSPPRRAQRGGMRGRRSYRGTARCPGSGWRARC